MKIKELSSNYIKKDSITDQNVIQHRRFLSLYISELERLASPEAIEFVRLKLSRKNGVYFKNV